MIKKLGGALLALGAPMLAAGLLIAPSASAATTAATVTATGPRTTPLRVQAKVGNSRPRDRSTEYIEVTTAKGARVTAVAHFRAGPQTRAATANARGEATIAYAVGNATPGDRVVVTVTATSGHDHAVTVTYFTPQR